SLGDIAPPDVLSSMHVTHRIHTEARMQPSNLLAFGRRGITSRRRSNASWLALVFVLCNAEIVHATSIMEFGVTNQPTGIARGPDGNMWFTERSGTAVGRIAPDGKVEEFNVPGQTGGDGFYAGICLGPDGNLWFADARHGAIEKITTSGSISEFPLPKPETS